MQVLVFESTVVKSCVCNSWLTHWEKCSALRAVSCSEKLCRRLDVVGTQVKKLMMTLRCAALSHCVKNMVK